MGTELLLFRALYCKYSKQCCLYTEEGVWCCRACVCLDEMVAACRQKEQGVSDKVCGGMIAVFLMYTVLVGNFLCVKEAEKRHEPPHKTANLHLHNQKEDLPAMPNGIQAV